MFLFINFIIGFSFAQSKSSSGLDPEVIGVQTQIESWVTERMKRLVSTTLEEKAYSISAQVKIRKRKVEKSTSELPSDMTLGWLENGELSSGRPQFDLPSLADSPLENFEILRIEVSLGLSEKLDKQYVDKMESWIKKRVRRDFGRRAVAKVTRIGSLPKEKVEIPPEKPKTWEDYVKDYQYLLGFLLVALSLMVGIFLLKLLPSRDANAQRKLALELNQSQKSQQALAESPGQNSKELEGNINVNLMAELRTYRDLIAKVGLLTFELKERILELVSTWLENDPTGHEKVASLMDAMMSWVSQQSSEITPIPFVDIPVKEQKRMKEVFNKMQALSVAEKKVILESVYWDLVSLKTLGVGSLSSPFGFLGQLPPGRLATLVSDKGSKSEALLALHLPDRIRSQFLGTKDMEEKKRLLLDSLNLQKISLEDVKNLEREVKPAVSEKKEDSQEVSLRPLQISLLETLPINERIVLLREVGPLLENQFLKSEFPTLAFVDEWPETVLKSLISIADSSEIITLLRLVPEVKNQVIKVCAPRLAEIVEDDIKRKDTTSNLEKQAFLNSLEGKLKRLISNGQIQWVEVFSFDEGQSDAA